jgi:hypothetical protein
MKYKTDGNVIILKLEKGEKIIESLTALAEKEEIPSATFRGVGAVEQTTLGYFDVEALEYERKDFPFSMELGSLMGNITWLEGKPHVHAHAVICGFDLKAYTGHLFEGTISVTGEIIVTKFQTKIERAFDDSVGLNLINMD